MIRRRYLVTSLLLVIAVTISGLIYGLHSFSAQADRPVQKGIADITVCTDSQGFNLGTFGGAVFYYDFEPVGTFINVTEIYYNIEYSGAYTTRGRPTAHYLDFAPFATIDNSKTYLTLANTDTRTNLASFASAGVPSARLFDFHPIQPGVNILIIGNSQSGSGKTLYVYSLELFIQYNYYP